MSAQPGASSSSISTMVTIRYSSARTRMLTVPFSTGSGERTRRYSASSTHTATALQAGPPTRQFTIGAAISRITSARVTIRFQRAFFRSFVLTGG